MQGTRRAAVVAAAALVGALVTVLPVAVPALGPAAQAATPTLPPGFSDVEAIGDISEATTVAFAPDGTAFVALKTGVIKSFDYNAATSQFEGNATSTDFADLSTPVDNYWDRGLTGITTDPQFGTSGHDYVYVSYTYNRDPRDATPVVPKWGDPTEAYDECPTPATTDPPVAGCAAMMRVTRLSAQKGSLGWTMVPGSEKQLLAGGCFQFGSHASGDVIFGPDGKLYASAGEGASFDTNDYGQYADPCGDPADEGGSLRAQDYRSTGDALGIDGSIVRLDPTTELVPSQATAGNWLVAYGQRNPWRLTFRPGTNQLWSGDVGASGYEEVNRLDTATTVQTPVNRGWPCYEGTYAGSAPNDSWAALEKPLCQSLYAAVAANPATVTAPYFSYQTRGPKLVAGEDCQNSTSSVSGVAFTPATSAETSYPAAYRGAMFFSDYARSCVWMLGKKPNGDPDPATIVPFVQGASTPVQLKAGPGGDLYYVDYGLNAEGGVVPGGAGVHRIVYTGANAVPTAKITADKTSGVAPLTVAFDGTTSTDPDGDTLTYSWDLDGNGTYGDSTAAKPTKTYAAGTWTVGLRVDDGHGHTSTATQQVQAGNTAPVIGAVSPAAHAAYTVGDAVGFSGTATDTQDGTLPASAYTWQLSIRHCPGGVCHTHALQTYKGVTSGSFPAPDHEYPSFLLLTLTVTDSGGLTASKEIELDPRTVPLSFASSPAGATVTLTSGDHVAPYAETFLQNSRLTMTAAQTTTSGGETWAFGSWSDAGSRSHELSAPAAATTYTATYNRPTATLVASPTSGTAPLPVTYTASATSPGGGTGMTYAWDLDGDGSFDDGSGTKQSVTWSTPGSPVVKVRATDARGATDTEAVTVTVANAAPTARITTSGATGNAPLTVSFDATTSSDPNGDALTYDWDLDGNGSYETTSAAKPSKVYSSVGAVVVGLRVSDGRGGVGTATVTVKAENGAPTITSMTPTDATTYAVGQSLSLAATATDPQQTLPASAYAWKVERQDCASGCARSAVATVTGPSGSVTVPELPNPSRLVVTLTVSDSDGGSATLTRVLQPRTTTVRIATDPVGGTIEVGGTARTAPYDVTLVQGAHLTLTAPPTQGGGHTFGSWSDGGARSHVVTVPTSAATWTASYDAPPVVAPVNTAPSISGVGVYPSAEFSVGQTLGFDVTAQDAEQELPDAAYAVTLERQDCAAGCPRQVVRTWVAQRTGQLVVPAMPYPSRLFLTATVTDAQGVASSRTVAIEPRAAVLQVTTRAGTVSRTHVAGSAVAVKAPKRVRRKGTSYVFVRWSDGGARAHEVQVGDGGLVLKAKYRRR